MLLDRTHVSAISTAAAAAATAAAAVTQACSMPPSIVCKEAWGSGRTCTQSAVHSMCVRELSFCSIACCAQLGLVCNTCMHWAAPLRHFHWACCSCHCLTNATAGAAAITAAARSVRHSVLGHLGQLHTHVVCQRPQDNTACVHTPVPVLQCRLCQLHGSLHVSILHVTVTATLRSMPVSCSWHIPSANCSAARPCMCTRCCHSKSGTGCVTSMLLLLLPHVLQHHRMPHSMSKRG